MATILIVDDERLMCDLLAEVLAQAGHEVVTAYSAAEAIRQFSENRPTVTILDLILGDDSGLDVLRELRKIDVAAKVIVWTGAATLEVAEDARALGVEDFLQKNLNLKTMMRAVGDAISSTGGQATPAGQREYHAHILIVDDDAGVRQLLYRFLTREPEGYRVSTAVNGLEALDVVARDRPDLVLLDLSMPGMGGIECLRRLAKEAPAVGVIAISGAGDEGLVRHAIEFGSFDYFAKPLDMERLGISIRAKLVLMEGRRSRSRGA